MTLTIQRPTGSALNLRKEFTWNETVWNPSMITTALWLDAADTSTITESGGAVSQWDDKSGNARHVTQGAAANRPLRVANSLNGNPVVRLSTPTQHLISAASFGSAAQRSVFSLNTYKAAPQYQYIWNQETNPSSGAALVFRAQSNFSDWSQNDTISWADGYDNGRVPRFISSGITGNGAAAIHEISLGSQESILRVNGTSFAPRIQLTGAWPAIARRFSVGRETQSLKGDVAEIIYVDGAVPTTTRQKLEGYLAHKWGLTASLPASHPYKTVGPTP